MSVVVTVPDQRAHWTSSMLRWCLRSLLAIIVWVAAMDRVKAQGTGVRVIFPEWDRTMNGRSFMALWNFGVGVDRETVHGLRMGVDATFRAFYLGSGGTTEGEEFLYDGYRATYDFKPGGWSVLYRATYCTGGDGSGFYLGTFAGIRKVGYSMELKWAYDPNWSYGNGPFPDHAQASLTVYPVGLRCGFTSEVDGAYSDLYMMIGTQLGHARLAPAEMALAKGGEQVSGLTYSLGYAFGIGW